MNKQIACQNLEIISTYHVSTFPGIRTLSKIDSIIGEEKK